MACVAERGTLVVHYSVTPVTLYRWHGTNLKPFLTSIAVRKGKMGMKK